MTVVRIATWNVNSLRSRIDRVEAFLDRHEVDVLALQETKAREDQLPLMGIEARGFVFSAPVAHGLGAGLVPIRKPGKLPWTVDSITYELEYGGGTLEIHTDAVLAGHRCLIVDDVLATGGTAQAARQLVERQGGVVVGWSFLVELGFLGGRALLGGDAPVHSTIDYEG